MAAGAVAADRDAGRVGAELGRAGVGVAERGERVVDRGREAVLGREAVVDGEHAGARRRGEQAHGRVVGVEVADDPAAAVEEDEQGGRRGPVRLVGHVEARPQRPVGAGDGEPLHARQRHRRPGHDACAVRRVRPGPRRRPRGEPAPPGALLELQEQLRVQVELEPVAADRRAGEAPLDARRQRGGRAGGQELRALAGRQGLGDVHRASICRAARAAPMSSAAPGPSGPHAHPAPGPSPPPPMPRTVEGMTTTSGPAISVEGLVKSFGDVRALDGIDLEARTGTVLGLLGPNGAGQDDRGPHPDDAAASRTRGSARVAGFDVVREAAALREHIGLAGQYAAVDENLTGLENLTMVGRLYRLGRGGARARRRSCSSASASWRPPAGSSRPTRAACAAGSTSPRRSWRGRRCCSSTSPRPGSTRAAASTCGRRSRASSPTGPPCS